jgi:hypothetical protein
MDMKAILDYGLAFERRHGRSSPKILAEINKRRC